MVKQGFRNANSLALRLMNAVSSANGRRKRRERFAAMRRHPWLERLGGQPAGRAGMCYLRTCDTRYAIPGMRYPVRRTVFGTPYTQSTREPP